MIKRIVLCGLLTAVSTFTYAKVLIITHAFNRPDFIEMQNRTFKHLLEDDYEYVVFNDANTQANCVAIEQMCERQGVRCIRIPQEIHDRPYHKRAPDEPYHRNNIRHVNGVQYSLDVLGFKHDGIVFILDSDMFITRRISIEKYVGNNDIVAVFRGAEFLRGPQAGKGGLSYLWPGLCILNMKQLPEKEKLNFNCGWVEGAHTDSGGHTYYYLQAHPELKRRDVTEIFSYRLFGADRFARLPADTKTPVNEKIAKFKEMGFIEPEINFLLKLPHTISFLLDNHILHFRAGTNYDNQSAHYENLKMQQINDFINEVLSQTK